VAGKTAREAVRSFVEPIQSALVCFADGKVTADTYAIGKEGVLVVNRGEPFRLNGAEAVWLTASMRYEVAKATGRKGPFKVSTRGWIYHLDGPRRKRLIGYHWHPVSASHAMHPHLHAFEMGDKRHYPTGRILFEDVLQLATEYGAEPRDGKRWEDVSAENREKFALGATWGVGPSY
jgi:hypothetical protein